MNRMIANDQTQPILDEDDCQEQWVACTCEDCRGRGMNCETCRGHGWYYVPLEAEPKRPTT